MEARPRDIRLEFDGSLNSKLIISSDHVSKIFSPSDIDKFNKDLDKINWDTNDLNAHQYGNNFLHVFNQVLDIHAPLTKVKDSKNRIKQNAKPWITNNILKLIKDKDKIQKYIKE